MWNVDGDAREAHCLHCPDSPCIRFSETELSLPMRVDAPRSTDPSVCAWGALTFRPEAAPETSESCVGCGICASRCPVAAIHLSNVKAAVSTATGASLAASTADAHEAVRSTVEASLAWPSSVDVQLLLKQVKEAESNADAKALQLLTRNTFLLSGASARLGKQGDHNGLAECVVEDPATEHVFMVEIDRDGGLDGARRVLGSVAVACNRLGLKSSDVTPVVVFTRLPNLRSEYYRLVQDATNRLDVQIRTLTMSILLAQAHVPTAPLTERLRTGFAVSPESPSIAADARELFGIKTNAKELGLTLSQ